MEESEEFGMGEVGELLPCFKCERPITKTVGGIGGQTQDINGNVGFWRVPYGATIFSTYGHYGSTFWDSFNGERVQINICDECLNVHLDKMNFFRSYDAKSVQFFPEYLRNSSK